MSNIKWLIVWCQEDTSFSLINERDALFDDESLEIGETVTFFYNQREYSGDVVEMGDDAGYDHLLKRLSELNASNKKGEDSFHGDKPRKTRGKGRFKDALEALKSKRVKAANPSSCSSSQVSKKYSLKPLPQLMNTCSSSDNESDEDLNTSPDSSPIPESLSKKAQCETKQLQRISAAKGKAADNDVLKRSAKVNHQDKNNKKSDCGTTFKHQPCRSGSKTNRSDLSPHRSKGALSSCAEQLDDEAARHADTAARKKTIPVFEDSSEEEQLIHVPSKKKNKNRSEQVEKAPNKNAPEADSFFGAQDDKSETAEQIDEPSNPSTLLRFSKDDPDVVELRPKSRYLAHTHFYISSKILQSARLTSNASVFARHLLVGAFSDHALLTRTVSGGEYRAGGRDNITRKLALDQDVIALIIETALSRQEIKKWKPELSKKEILQGLRQKLVDMRPRLKKKLLQEKDE